MHRPHWRLAAMTLASLCACACGGRATAMETHPVVRLATGSQGVAQAFTELLPDISFVLVASSGSVTQLRALQSGDADVGTAVADVTYLAYRGQLERDEAAFTNLRGMAVLQPTAVQVLVPRGSRVTSIKQFKGLHVAIGAKGSETAIAAQLLLRAFGLRPSDVRSESLSFGDATNELVHGELDAAFFNGSYPTDAIAAAARAGARLLPIAGPEVERLRHEYPFLRRTLLPKGLYANNGAVHTVGLDNILLCRADLDPVLVYRLTKALLDALPFPAARIASFPRLDLMRTPATPLPLHTGAAEYYRERELLR